MFLIWLLHTFMQPSSSSSISISSSSQNTLSKAVSSKSPNDTGPGPPNSSWTVLTSSEQFELYLSWPVVSSTSASTPTRWMKVWSMGDELSELGLKQWSLPIIGTATGIVPLAFSTPRACCTCDCWWGARPFFSILGLENEQMILLSTTVMPIASSSHTVKCWRLPRTLALAWYLFFAALSVLPGKAFVILDHWLPIMPWRVSIILSSSKVQSVFFKSGCKWLHQRSRHCFPVLLEICFPTKVQLVNPTWSITLNRSASSSAVQIFFAGCTPVTFRIILLNMISEDTIFTRPCKNEIRKTLCKRFVASQLYTSWK